LFLVEEIALLALVAKEKPIAPLRPGRAAFFEERAKRRAGL
jgi:hypothetical protein